MALHVSFWLAVSVVGFVIWKLVEREYSTRLANAESTITMFRERLIAAQASEAIAAERIQEASEREPSFPADTGLSRITKSKTHAQGIKQYADESLLAALKGKSVLQIQSLIAPNIGKWMRIRGTIQTIGALPPEGAMIGLEVAKIKNLAFCVFENVSDELAALDIGKAVEIEGQIRPMNGSNLMLEDCALS